jgi:hypothetical protein
MNEYTSRFLRYALGALLGEKIHTSVYQDRILKKMKPISPETMEELGSIEERSKKKAQLMYRGLSGN